MAMHRNESGFSAVEVLLVLVIVAILGFTGWFVWNSQKNTNKTLSDTNKSQAATSKAEKNTPTTADATTKKAAIPEWGVAIGTPEGLDPSEITVTYVPSQNGKPDAVWVYSSKLKALKNTCQTNAANTASPFLIITRDTNNSTWFNMGAGYSEKDATKVGDWFYLVSTANIGGCYDKAVVDPYLTPATRSSVQTNITAL